jgi:hypothetical protein
VPSTTQTAAYRIESSPARRSSWHQDAYKAALGINPQGIDDVHQHTADILIHQVQSSCSNRGEEECLTQLEHPHQLQAALMADLRLRTPHP